HGRGPRMAGRAARLSPVAARAGYGRDRCQPGDVEILLPLPARLAVQLVDRAVRPAQAGAELAAEVGEQLDCNRRPFRRKRHESCVRQDVADQLLIRFDRGRARLLVKQSQLAEYRSGREGDEPGGTLFTRQLDADACAAFRDHEEFLSFVALAEDYLAFGV